MFLYQFDIILNIILVFETKTFSVNFKNDNIILLIMTVLIKLKYRL